MSDLAIQGNSGERLSTDDFVVPFERNPWFTGRKRLLEILKGKLFDQASKKFNHRVALYGMGGIGKTQTALEYVYSHRNAYKRIYWITAVDQASLLSGYQEIAQKAGIKGLISLEPVQIAKNMLTWLRQEESWLLVIDNLDGINVVFGYLPENGPQKHTLITTRNPNSNGIPAEGLEVPLLDVVDSIDLLSTLSHIDIVENSVESVQAAQIVEQLGCLPLAIEQAAAFVREIAGDFATFLDDYQKNHQDVHQWVPHGYRSYPYSVATTWFMSFNIVQKNHPRAAKLFQVLSFLNPDGVLIDFLQSGIEGLPIDLQAMVASRMDLSKALLELERFSLLKWNRVTKTLVIHRLVQTAIRDQMSEQERTSLSITILNICDESFPKVLNNDTRPVCRVYFGQVLVPLLNIKYVQTMSSADVMERVSEFLCNDGKYSDAIKLLEEVVEIRAARGGADDQFTLTSVNNLALTYQQQGKISEAAKLHEEVLAKRRVILGNDHLDTLTTMQNLALTYQQQGKLSEATKMHEEVLAKSRVILGDDHPDTLTSMHNLVLTTYRQQGKLSEAAKMYEEVLAKRRVILGDDHPDTLTSMHNLALTYREQGKLLEAAKMHEEVLSKFRVIFGDDHPFTLTGMHNLALTYRQQGKLSEAAKMHEEVLAKHRMILGHDHPNTLTSMDNLAETYRQQGKLSEAATMHEEVLAKRRVIFGDDHPDTLTSMHNLAETYRRQGKLSEAAKMHEEVLAKCKVIFGDGHPDTLTSIRNLALTYQQQRKLSANSENAQGVGKKEDDVGR